MTKAAVAEVTNFVAQRQKSVYDADANSAIYEYRKSQENPMVKKIYAKDQGRFPARRSLRPRVSSSAAHSLR